jgi:hypothetical protein
MNINQTSTASIVKINGVQFSSIIKVNNVTVSSPIPFGTVLSDLIMYLDAGVSASYPGTGTTWTDITVNTNDGTLTNGPTYMPAYNTLNSANIQFDGTNDYVNLGTTIDFSTYTGGFTFGFWIRILDTSTTNRYIFSKLTTAGTDNQFSVVYGYVSQTLQLYSGTCSQTLITGSNIVINDNDWHFVCYTVGTTTTGYLDGNHVAFANTYGSAPTFTSSSGSNLISSFDGSQYFGNLAVGVLFLYDRILSSSEVVQNFNTLIDRYRLTISGLVLYLSGGILTSYPGTGTTWTDLTGNSNNGTLTNGPTYTSTNGGAIVFDGTDDSINFPTTSLSSTGNITIDAFLKLDGTQVAYADIIDYSHPSGGFVVQQNYGSSADSFYFAWWNGSGYDFCFFQVPIDNTYFHLAITKVGGLVTAYINGESVSTGSGASTLGATGLTMKIGDYVGGGRSIKGTIGDFRIYNIGLTQAEVLQNLSALCTRFLPTPANSFDAGNTTSYPGSGTTWYNINGTPDATLYNGITYSADGGGSLVFDGSNDYAIIPYDSSFDFSTGNYTISSWVKFTSSPSTATITAKDTNGANFDWCIYFPDTTHIYNYSNGTSTNVNATLGSPVSTGTWYLVTISSISGVNSIYLNGVQYGTSTYMSTSNSNTTALTIGSVSWNSPSLFLAGKIAIMEYYTVGLTSAEVLLNFNKNKKRFGY